jgi:hypothetical protein
MIYAALREYAGIHGRLPSTLSALREEGLMVLDGDFESPERQGPDSQYAFVSNVTLDDPGKWLLVFDGVPNPSDSRRLVLFVDGTVKEYTEVDFEVLYKKVTDEMRRAGREGPRVMRQGDDSD